MRIWVKTASPEISFRLQGMKITHYEYVPVINDHNVQQHLKDKSLVEGNVSTWPDNKKVDIKKKK
jgi:hypothetical protein